MGVFNKVPLLVWLALITVVILAGGVLVVSKLNLAGDGGDSRRPEKVSKEVDGTVVYDIVSREHIQSGTSGSGYNSNPPSSGPHWNGPANKGFHDENLPDEQLLHNLEHGYIWISYKPDVADDVKNKLKEIVSRDDWKIVLAPRKNDETQIALAAWGRVLKLDNLNEKRIRDFIKTYRNRGPEKTPD